MFDLQACARPNILTLKPYRCARHDFKNDGNLLLLDANENAQGPGLALGTNESSHSDRSEDKTAALFPISKLDKLGYQTQSPISLGQLNRYPDPHQIEIKQMICDIRNGQGGVNGNDPGQPREQQPGLDTGHIKPENICLGNGSDECIDSLIRCFCRPGRDKILICQPTYGMYAVWAQINGVEVVSVPLRTQDDFTLDVHSVIQTLTDPAHSQDGSIKLVFLCSPGNPTGKLLDKKDILQVLTGSPEWNGVVAVDEAYIDFAPTGSSMASEVTRFPNLVVMQTLSKYHGLAAVRTGVSIAPAPIARLLNTIKAPYNISGPSSELAKLALSPQSAVVVAAARRENIRLRDRLRDEILKLPGCQTRIRGGLDANFVLFQMRPLSEDCDQDSNTNPEEIDKACNKLAASFCDKLAHQSAIIVRYRGTEIGCAGCVRVTVGTEAEITRFVESARKVLGQCEVGKD